MFNERPRFFAALLHQQALLYDNVFSTATAKLIFLQVKLTFINKKII